MSDNKSFSPLDILKFQFNQLSETDKVAFIADLKTEQKEVQKVNKIKKARKSFNQRQQDAFYQSLVQENNAKFSEC